VTKAASGGPRPAKAGAYSCAAMSKEGSSALRVAKMGSSRRAEQEGWQLRCDRQD